MSRKEITNKHLAVSRLLHPNVYEIKHNVVFCCCIELRNPMFHIYFVTRDRKNKAGPMLKLILSQNTLSDLC